uniref:NADAR domain-containing protein n=1 Tax=Globodera rostochiensis TaxID=31243 RepID=A0A914I5V2_GLORO
MLAQHTHISLTLPAHNVLTAPRKPSFLTAHPFRMSIIPFLSNIRESRFLSNFYPAHLTYHNNHFQSSEHCYQSQKAEFFGRMDLLELINASRRATEQKRLGAVAQRSASPGRVARWHDAKTGIMREILAAKFENPELAQRLINTGCALLVEASPSDRFWGAGASYSQVLEGRFSGRNVMGRLLMQLRDRLQKGKQVPPATQ